MREKTIKIALSLGGNLGNVAETFASALAMLSENGVAIEKKSSVISTAPVDCPPGTPDFCNMAVTGYWQGSPQELLALTQSAELAAGRPAEHGYHTPRTLDIDIILFGGECVAEPELQIPHVRAAERYFVLKPLEEIAPEMIFPDTGKSVKKCLLEFEERTME